MPSCFLALEAGDGLVLIGMGLQRQRLGRGHQLQQVRQIAGDRLQRRAVVERRGRQRVRAHPPLRPRSPIGRSTEHLGDRRDVSPCVVLCPPVDRVHASTR